MKNTSYLSNLFKGSVLSLMLLVFLQASSASASIPIGDQTQLEAIGENLGEDYVVVNSFEVVVPSDEGSTYVTGTFTGTFDGGGYLISGLTKPLFHVIGHGSSINDLRLKADLDAGVSGNGILANESNGTINNVDVTGDVSGTNYVGGLVGLSYGSISESSATGDVSGADYVGGLVGHQRYNPITNSYSQGTVTGTYSVGGLVGESFGGITSSYAISSVTGGSERTGGLAGFANYVPITNSYAEGSVTGTDDVGGLAGLLYAGISNSYSGSTVTGVNRVGGLAGFANYVPITNSYAEGSVDGNWLVGGLVGQSWTTIIDSHANGEVTGVSEVGEISGQQAYVPIVNSYATGRVVENNIAIRNADTVILPNIPLQVLNYDLDKPVFAQYEGINSGLPYLISNSPVDAASEDTAANLTFSLEPFYSQAAQSLEKALTPLGFKSNFSPDPNLGFQALTSNQGNLPAAIQLFEVADYQNSNILLNKEDGFQLSITSYYKEPLEIWTQGLDGAYIYLGRIEFDQNGKAILPTLKFAKANSFQLLLIKAASEQSKKPNLEVKIGQINITVN